jgi:hypothetical protein
MEGMPEREMREVRWGGIEPEMPVAERLGNGDGKKVVVGLEKDRPRRAASETVEAGQIHEESALLKKQSL